MAEAAPPPAAGRAGAPPDKGAIRDAATVILWRTGAEGPEVLMGTRGAAAAFMPNKVVFPGGAVDPADAHVPLAGLPGAACLRRLADAPRAGVALHPEALLAAAIREVWEETGLLLGSPGAWEPPHPDWHAFAVTGHRPDAAAFRFVFRAVTPPGRPRRFDARFFLVPAAAVVGDADDFSRAAEELSHLHWIPLARVRAHDLPFITEVVLGEIAPLLAAGGAAQAGGVPLVTNDDPVSSVVRLR
ncbi:NUDIX domain-containing protein [Rhodovulum sp. 12E13]|uniref:NUDIX hydrolase n=1 Tax=Rhodovulum sp. 12E13 TaxID=2203891 RepID=UPI000E11A3EB|nr:NUDIX domain-containing protein [Rhodovulum sp. 12E13]RDC68036.1 NUDIX domain-containing protein [Rhodovulum sp. 12E13]